MMPVTSLCVGGVASCSTDSYKPKAICESKLHCSVTPMNSIQQKTEAYFANQHGSAALCSWTHASTPCWPIQQISSCATGPSMSPPTVQRGVTGANLNTTLILSEPMAYQTFEDHIIEVPVQIATAAPGQIHERTSCITSQQSRLRGLDLGKAFWTFCQANALQQQLKGQTLAEAEYSKACCFSIAVEEQIRACQINSTANCIVSQDGLDRLDTLSHVNVVAPDLPPNLPQGSSMRTLVESRLNLCLQFLQAALVADSQLGTRILKDPDLHAVRELRSLQFNKLLQESRS